MTELLGDAWRQQKTPPTGEVDVAALAKQVLIPRVDAKEAFARVRRRNERLDAVLLHPVLGPAGLPRDDDRAVRGGVPHRRAGDRADRSRQPGARRAARGLRSATGWLASLLVDGVLGGAGTVLAFLPQIVILTIAMELIDASGYLARGAFLVDRLLRFAGLGRAIVRAAAHRARLRDSRDQGRRASFAIPASGCAPSWCCR